MKENLEQPHAGFEKIQYKENGMLYKFPHVGIVIDTSGKNQNEYPELLFGTYDEDLTDKSMNQPLERLEGIDMEYITECLRQVAEDSGVHTFWFYPYEGDSPENPQRRHQARLRLFKRFWNVTPSPTGFGYVLEI